VCPGPDLHHKGVKVDDWIEAFERACLPGADFIYYSIRYLRNERRRNFYLIDFFKVSLNLAHRHAASLQRQNLVVETREASLTFSNYLRLEASLAITRYIYRQSAEVAFEGLFRFSVSRIARVFAFGRVFLITEMMREFGFEGAFEDSFCELL
jgi:hypothetical protein